ncbi:hypothetical protein BGX31_002239 [Mortierella sp. GBA43]|nr:hypothetical protein BGX31_002239 [Mortierella sp. GBA43]
MGTSSILSATILAVLKTLKGEAFTMDDILYQTLDVEQMMNTGKWMATSTHQWYRFHINTKSIDLSSEFINSFNSRLLLIFTGQTRLAKNLLQTVLMNWAGQEPAVVETMDRLVKDATECENVLTKGDWAGVGTVLSRYFTDKRFLSNTTLNDPSVIARLLTHLGPYIEGASLAGAGGGGFLAALLKPSFTREDVVSKVRVAMANDKGGSAEDEESMWAWQATVDTQGLVIGIGS